MVYCAMKWNNVINFAKKNSLPRINKAPGYAQRFKIESNRVK